MDTFNNNFNCPKIGIVWIYNAEMRPKDTDGMANSVGPDQTAPCRSSLIWAYTGCLDLHVPKFRNFTVFFTYEKEILNTAFPTLAFLRL